MPADTDFFLFESAGVIRIQRYFCALEQKYLKKCGWVRRIGYRLK